MKRQRQIKSNGKEFPHLDKPLLAEHIIARAAGLDTAIVLSETAPVDQGEKIMKKGKLEDVKLQGYSLCWHGRWLCKSKDVEALCALRAAGSLNTPALCDASRRAPSLLWLWDRFKRFLKERATAFGFPDFSGKMELTLKSREYHQLVHLHACVSNPRQRLRLNGTNDWFFLGAPPMIFNTNNRGRKLDQVLASMHYYHVAPKIGSIFTCHSYGLDLMKAGVPQASIYNLWCTYKMDDSTTIAELRKYRGFRTEAYVASIKKDRSVRKEIHNRAVQAFLRWLLPCKPSKQYALVLDWMSPFCSDSSGWGVYTRFKFLVLVGDSLYGKTQFGINLWGPERTLVVSAQGMGDKKMAPDLSLLDRDVHFAIVMDEGDWQLAYYNKQLFQSGLDEVRLGQSTCNQFAYSVWLYAMPIIICCNTWLDGAPPDAANWCEKNSVVVEVTSKMYVDQSPPPLVNSA